MLSKDRRNTAGLRLRAAIRIEQGQFDQAIADLREALNDQPKSPELLSLMALAYERSGKNELAERQYADALKASGFNPSCWPSICQLLAASGRRSAGGRCSHGNVECQSA